MLVLLRQLLLLLLTLFFFYCNRRCGADAVIVIPANGAIVFVAVHLYDFFLCYRIFFQHNTPALLDPERQLTVLHRISIAAIITCLTAQTASKGSELSRRSLVIHLTKELWFIDPPQPKSIERGDGIVEGVDIGQLTRSKEGSLEFFSFVQVYLSMKYPAFFHLTS